MSPALAGTNLWFGYLWLACARDCVVRLRWRVACGLIIIDTCISTQGPFWLCTRHAKTFVSEHLLIELRMLISHRFPAFSWLYPGLVLCCCGELSCSTSSPGGNLVDGLPSAANINGWSPSIFSGSGSHILYVKTTVGYHGHILPHAKRRCHPCTWARACRAQRIA